MSYNLHYLTMFLFQRLTLYLQTKLEKMIAVKHVKLICCLLIRRYEIKQLNVKQYEYTIILFPGMSKKKYGRSLYEYE